MKVYGDGVASYRIWDTRINGYLVINQIDVHSQEKFSDRLDIHSQRPGLQNT